MIIKSVVVAAFLCAVCSPTQAREDISSPIIIGVSLPRPQLGNRVGGVSHISGNVDGIYAGGSHLVLFGNDGSFKWGRSIPCLIEAIHALPNGGVVTTGRCSKKTGRTVRAVGPSVLRFDARGNLVWARTIVAGKKTRLRKLSADSAGDIYVAGYVAKKQKRQYPNRGYIVHLDAFIVRLTEAGDVKWGRTFVSDINSHGTEIDALVPMSKSRIAMTVSDNLVILDALGKPIGAHRLRLNGLPLDLGYMSQAGGNFVLSGGIRSNGPRGLDVWAVSLSPLGQVGWAVRLDVGAADQVWSVTGTPDAITTIAGSTKRMGPTLEDKVHRRDGWLVRIGQNGEIIGSFAVGYDGDDHFGTAAENDGVLALTGNIGDGRAGGRRFLAFNPHVSSTTKKCLAIKKAATKVNRIHVESVPSAVSLKVIKISGKRFKSDIISVVPGIQDLCNGAPQSGSR